MSDESQNGPQDPNAPEGPAEGETPQADPGTAKPFYLRPPVMAAAGAAVIAIAAILVFTGSPSDQVSEPMAKAETTETGDTATEANVAGAETDWDLGRPGDIVMGSPDAPVKLVEYASTTCSHCAAFELTVFPHIKKKYIDTGLVQFTLREFPTPPVSLSIAGFMLARCTGEERYYSAIDALFRTQPLWVKPNPQEARMQLEKIASQFGLNDEQFEACIRNEQELERIRGVVKAGQEVYGINSTPSFVINGRKAEIRGATFAALDSLIKDHLPEGTVVPEYTPAGTDPAATHPGEAHEDENADEGADGAADEPADEEGTAEEGTAEEGTAGESPDTAADDNAAAEGTEEGSETEESAGEDGTADDAAGESGDESAAEEETPSEK